MYEYTKLRPNLFTENGQVLFLKIRDHTRDLLNEAGAVRATEVMQACMGDSWLKMACLDRMVELDELQEITPPDTKGQHRVFISKS